MRLTRYSDYALRMLMYLAVQPDQQGTIAVIAEAYGISENHLVKVAHRLGQLGFIQTTRGRGGGLRLGQPAAAITVGGVVRQTEDDLALVECFAGGFCVISAPCRLRRALSEALAAFLAVLDGYTLADLVDEGAGLAIAGLLGLEPNVRSDGRKPDRA